MSKPGGSGRPHVRRQKSGYGGKIVGNYDLEQTIGKGHYAVVKLARHVFSGAKVAVKVIDKTKLDEVSKAHLFQEVTCMKLVQHPNVVRLYEVIDTQTKLYLILELGDGGDMYDYIMKHEKGLEEEMARQHFKQIVQAINYCHKLHVVHRDLKPENVVFFEKLGVVKLTDFGFSNKFIPGTKLETSCGSLAYSAPEILLGDSYDAPAVDIWSLGVILYMLVCGEPPFREANDSETLTMIMDCKYKLPNTLSKECQDLISLMLVREPGKRATLQDIVKHPWVMGGKPLDVPMLPLISREHLSEEDHAYIVQKMVEYRIGSKEEIMQSLEKDAYDHITATYYLMAEHRLRKQHEEMAGGLLTRKQEADSKPNLAPLALSPRPHKTSDNRAVAQQTGPKQPSPPQFKSNTLPRNFGGKTVSKPKPSPKRSIFPWKRGVQSKELSVSEEQRRPALDSLVSPPGTHRTSPSGGVSETTPGRKCSLIAEESIEEDEEDMDLDGLQQNRSLEDYLSDDSDARSVGERSSGRSPGSAPPCARRAAKPLHSVRSSPQLLKQIYEEGESEDDERPLKKMTSPRRSLLASPEALRNFDPTRIDPSRKKRFSHKHRGTSCSSSDASDTDETDTRRRKEKLKHRFHRRDSSDHSSDTDGPSGPSVGGPGGGGSGRVNGHSRSGRSTTSDRGSRKSDSSDNKHKSSSGKEKKHGGFTKQNLGNLTLGFKDENLPPEKIGNLTLVADLPPEKERKISNVSLGSGVSNLSLTSLGSRSGKYLSPRKESDELTSSEVEAMNEENKARTRVIHVRSKEFSDLMDKFRHSTSDHEKDDSSSVNSKCGIKFRRRTKVDKKTDINRNENSPRGGDTTAVAMETDEVHSQNSTDGACMLDGELSSSSLLEDGDSMDNMLSEGDDNQNVTFR